MSSLLAKRDLTPQFISLEDSAKQEIAQGLLQHRARLSPKYFYDAIGSTLFEAICQLDEYYLTRAEAAIFSHHAEEIAQATGAVGALIDLGAGNCEKAAGLFGALQPDIYVPVDISEGFLLDKVAALRKRFPAVPMQPVAMDFSETLQLPEPIQERTRKLFFYPGSSLGNFAPLQALQFLQRMRAACGDGEGGILIGVDLVKDAETLQAAYDDGLGVTAAFNLNALRHVNRILASDFDPRDWAHVAVFNAQQSRVEMHLRACSDVTVRWPEDSRHFGKGEHIHTESSYKFTRETLTELLAQAGFGDAQCWSDPAQTYLVCHARAI
jgi:dimethylhistidine N-methyltransferase